MFGGKSTRACAIRTQSDVIERHAGVTVVLVMFAVDKPTKDTLTVLRVLLVDFSETLGKDLLIA